MVRIEMNSLRSFGQLLEFEATRSIDLLRAVDDAIYACCHLRDHFDALVGACYEAVERIKRVETTIDADGSILKLLENGRDALRATYEKQKVGRDRLAASEALHEDGVVEAFDTLLDSMASAHNAANELCWALGEHDADLDEVIDGEFTTAEDLIEALQG